MSTIFIFIDFTPAQNEPAQAETGVLRSRIYKLKHISTTDAEKFLTELNISKEISHLPQNAMIVTSDKPLDLIKASSLLGLIDSEKPFGLKILTAVTDTKKAPDIVQIAAEVSGIAVGTLTEPPTRSTQPSAIIDVHNSELIAIAAFDDLDKIEAAVKKLLKSDTEPAEEKPAQPEITSEQLAELAEQYTKAQPLPDAEPEISEKQQPAPEEKPKTEEKPDNDLFQDQLLDVLDQAQQEAEEKKDRKLTDSLQGDLTDAQKQIARLQMQMARQKAETDKQIELLTQKIAIQPEPEKQPEKQEDTIPTQPTAEQDPMIAMLKMLAEKTPPPVEQPKPDQRHIENLSGKMKDPEKVLETITVELPEEVELISLIELVGKQLGLNYIYEPKDVAGKITLKIHDGKIKVKDTYALLETVLKFKGLVMTRREEGNLVIIVKKENALEQDPVIRADAGEIQLGDVIVTSVFKLNHISTASAENMLKNMSLGLDNKTAFQSIPETQTLIITDYAYRISRIKEILDMVDVPGEPRISKFRQLEYTIPSDITPKIEALVTELKIVSVTVGAQPAAANDPDTTTTRDPKTGRTITRPTPSRPTPTTTKKDESQDSVYLEADDRTNRLIMIGKEADLEVINQLIDNLDIAEQSLKFIKEYKITYIEASDVVDVMNELGLISTSSGRTTAAGRTPSRTPSRTPTSRTQPQPAAPSQTTSKAAPDEPQFSIRQTSNSLLVNASAEQHKAIELIITHIDVEQKDSRTIREYEIQHVDTAEIVDTLAELGIITKTDQRQSSSRDRQQQDSRVSSRTSRTTPEGAAGPQEAPVATLPTMEGEFSEVYADEPQIAILESTNALLINATPRQHAAIAMVISHVDREIDEPSTPYVIYALKNQKPEELAATLNDLIGQTVTTTTVAKDTSATDKVQTKRTPTATLPGREDERIEIIPDESSYSLIVFANKKNQQWISRLIEELDTSRSQVLLDVTLVEISKDNDFNFDLDLVSKHGGFIPGESMTGITALLDPFPTGRQTIEGAVTSGSGIAFYADQDIQALIEMMDKKSYGRILARPSILVKDNELGEIRSEKTIFVGEERTQTITGDGGNLSSSSNIEFKDYQSGITLTITPHIASDKLLQLEIVLDRTDFDPADTGTATIGSKTVPKPLNTVSSNVGTWAILPDGATIILGGIETISQNKGVTKVPLLGDLPLLGTLFRGIDETDKQSKLYVFVKAHIIKPGDELTGASDIELISRKKREAFESDETRFQGLDAVPGIKPNPMEPEKILEDDEYIKKLREAAQRDDPSKAKVTLD